jgi:Carboxypeptidase regulatory-like domain
MMERTNHFGGLKMMRNRIIETTTNILLLALLALVMLPLTALRAQVATADLLGTLTDPAGAIVPGAEITVTNTATAIARKQESDANGTFTFVLLPPGQYTVTVQKEGFKTQHESGITLTVGDRRRLDVSLAVGNVLQTVAVTSAATTLQTDSSSTGTLIPSKLIQELPLNGRNFITLVQLAAGAADSSPGFSGGNAQFGGDDQRLTSQLQVNGQYSWANNYLIDGMDNNQRFIGTIIVKPAIESIQEMEVTTSNYGADLGRTAGAVVNMITRSGTNEFHGSAYEYFRNQVMDARNFFARSGSKQVYRQNQYGGSLGGPIRRDKTFFFVDYEGLRLGQGQVDISTVPLANGVVPIQPNTALAAAAGAFTGGATGGERTGNFSGIAPIYDPTSCPPASSVTTCTRTQFPGNIVPANRIDRSGLALLNAYPLPNYGSPGLLTNNYLSKPVTTNNTDTTDARLDLKFNDRNSAFFRYTYSNTRYVAPGPIYPVANGTYTSEPTQGLGFSYVHTFTPRLIADLQFSWSRFVVASLPGSYGKNLSSTLLGIANINVNTATSQISAFTASDGSISSAGDQPYTPEYNTDDDFEVKGGVIRNWGTHTLKFGAEDRFRADWVWQSQDAAGTFAFTQEYTQANTATGYTPNTGLGVASIILGYPNSTTRTIQLSRPQYRYKEFAAYAMDDWRALPWLTLNLGVRYDYYGPEYTANNEMSNFNFTTNKLQTAGTGGWGSSAGVTNGKLNISPRVGYAATLTRKSVIRGAFDMVYVPFFVGTPYAMRNGQFVSQFSTLTSQFFPVLSLTNQNPSGGSNSPDASSIPIMPAPAAADPNNPFGEIDAVRPFLKIPYNYQVTQAFQQDLGFATVTVRYVGVLGRQQALISPFDVNAPTPGPPATSQQRRPYNTLYPNLQALALYGNTAFTNYNALQVSVERNLSHGLGGFGNYTYGHALDNFEYQPLDNSNILANPLGGYRTVSGNSDIDLRVRLAAALTYNVETRLHGWLGDVINGFGLDAIFQTQSGVQPYSVTNSTDVAGTNEEGGNRPNVVGNYTKGGNIGSATGCPTDVHNSHAYVGSGNIQWFNTCAFAVQATGTYGDLGRYQEFGPHQTALNFAASKEIRIREQLQLQLRGELFNAFNHPNFGLPGAVLGSGNFGQISSTGYGALGLPRNVQLAAKFTF